MPITLQISHPDRMLIGIVRGTVAPQDLDGFFAQLMGDKRPVEVFPNIHAARRWLDENS